MKYLDFVLAFDKKMLVTTQDIRNVFSGINDAQLFGWQKKGLIKKVKRGMLVFVGKEIDRHILSNEMNFSYISLEYALAFHQLIPDIAQVVTAVSKKRNEKIENDFGFFYYQKIKPELFAGFILIESTQMKNRFFRLASPEKALFDLVYFRADLKEKKDFESLRLNLPMKFDLKKIRQYTELVKAPQIKLRLNSLIEFLTLCLASKK